MSLLHIMVDISIVYGIYIYMYIYIYLAFLNLYLDMSSYTYIISKC